MKLRIVALLPIVALLLGLSPLVAQASEAPEPQKRQDFSRVYQIRHLNLHVAEVLAWDQCAKQANDFCTVTAAGSEEAHGLLTVRADRETHERIARALAQRDVMPPTRFFQLVAVVADQSAGGVDDSIPPRAREALQDVVDFLPYRGYRLLDQAFLRTTSNSGVVLDNPGEGELQVSLSFRATGETDEDLMFRHFRVVANPGRELLSTSFSMSVGETVVVGTSKLGGGGDALVVLLTAVE